MPNGSVNVCEGEKESAGEEYAQELQKRVRITDVTVAKFTKIKLTEFVAEGEAGEYTVKN